MTNGKIRCEQCGSREWVMIQDCRVCSRCGAVWPVQRRRELVPVWPRLEEHLVT